MSDRLPLLIARGCAVKLIWWCPPLRDAVNRWVRPYQGELSPAERAGYVLGQLDRVFRAAGVDPESLAGKDVLEIGPGGNFGLAAALLAFGASRVICLDRDRLCFDQGIDEGLAAELDRALGGCVAALVDERDGRCALPHGRFAYRFGAPIEACPFADSSFDLVFSCACLEHVDDPVAAIREMHRVLRPGGRMLHQIDFRDHRDFARPLEFLRYSDRMWSFLSAGSHTNRWRPSQFVAALGDRGFRITYRAPTGDELSGERVRADYLGALRPHLNPRFAGLGEDDLTTLGMLIVCEKSP